MRLSEIGTQNIVCIALTATAAEAAQLMREEHVGDLIVVDPDSNKKQPQGIVTDRDLVTFVMAANLDANTVQVGDIMARNLAVAAEDDSISDLCRKMRAAGVRRMPIVDSQGELAAIVSIDDVYQVLSEGLNNLVGVTSNQILREEFGRASTSRFL